MTTCKIIDLTVNPEFLCRYIENHSNRHPMNLFYMAAPSLEKPGALNVMYDDGTCQYVDIIPADYKAVRYYLGYD